MTQASELSQYEDVKANQGSVGVPLPEGYRLLSQTPLTGGVSGARVEVITIQNGSDPMRLVHKYEDGILALQHRAENQIGEHLPIVRSLRIGDAEHSVFYPLIEAPLVTDKVLNPEGDDIGEIMSGFVNAHRQLWDATRIQRPGEEIGGYLTESKIESTFYVAEQQYKDMIEAVGIEDPEGRREVVVNGVNVGTLENNLAKMRMQIERVRDMGISVMTHGDENPDNCFYLGEEADDRYLMMDYTSSDHRAPYEPIVKLLGWFPATKSEGELSIEDEQGNLRINSAVSIHESLIEATRVARSELNELIDDQDILAAFMGMYLLRELQWMERRGRENLRPFVFSMAMEFLNSIDGEEKPFPISEKYESHLPSSLSSDILYLDNLEMHSQSQEIRINSLDDLEALSQGRIAEIIRNVEVLGFDLDGTIVGLDSGSPQEGLSVLSQSESFYIVIASGAGPASVVKKIERAGLVGIFNREIITNEGATVCLRDTLGVDLTRESIVSENLISGADAGEIIKRIGRTPGVDFIGFYPSVDSEEDPFTYIVHVPGQDQSIIQQLKEKYGDNVSFIYNQEEFGRQIEQTGSSKIVVKSSDVETRNRIQEDVLDFNQSGIARAVVNEGYINIVAANANKGNGLLGIANGIGLNEDQVIHFGNDYNDLEALATEGISVVVDSDNDQTVELLREVKKHKKSGYNIIVSPKILNQFLIKLLEIKNG